jgi:hypothetical protein
MTGDLPKLPSGLLSGYLGPLEGARIPGGCEYCDAYQTVEPIQSGAWIINVHHDDWCPWVTQHEAGER